MSSKYVDTKAICQVIAAVYKNPSLLDNENYTITEDDFSDDFHKVVFGSIFKIHELGAKEITLDNISDFLSTRPKSLAIYQNNKGDEYLMKISDMVDLMSFDYYYNRMKKMTLLRMYDSVGVDVSDIYDTENILDTKKKQMQEEFLDNSSLITIADLIDDKITQIRIKYAEDETAEAFQVGDGLDELIEDLKKHPEVGIPMFGPMINSVTRGARLKKFYLRSAASGLGKSRTLAADACYFSCDEIYNIELGIWRKKDFHEPTLFITTELELSEIQTMMVAFLSAVNEEHILNGKYDGDEEERVRYAVQILKRAPLFIEELPDFSLQDVENVIKRNIREHEVRYVCFDYIHTSMKILEEIASRSGGVKLREDNVLFMLSNKLKDLCNKNDIFLISATQLNANYTDHDAQPDQSMLRGSKAIADKIDWGGLMLTVNDDDLKALEKVIGSSGFAAPQIKLSVYKNRRGRYKGIYLWCKADMGCCRLEPQFATTWGYELIKIDNLQIELEESAF